MQQLTLFSNQAARRTRPNYRKRPIKRSIASSNWNLWTQGDDHEKEMALFFLDIRNFTSLAEKHQPSDVIHIIRKLFSTFQNIIRNHHGQIIETAGDGFYAAFGFDSDIATAVNEAIHAGTGILETLQRLNSESFEKNLQRRIEVGIGIHSGKVATGNLLVGDIDHVIVMGYAVNVAARIQAATKELNNNFVISSTAFKTIGPLMPEKTKVRVTLKGVTDPLDVFLLGKAYR